MLFLMVQVYDTPGYASQMDFWTPGNPNAANPMPIYSLGNKRGYGLSTRRNV